MGSIWVRGDVHGRNCVCLVTSIGSIGLTVFVNEIVEVRFRFFTVVATGGLRMGGIVEIGWIGHNDSRIRTGVVEVREKFVDLRVGVGNLKERLAGTRSVARSLWLTGNRENQNAVAAADFPGAGGRLRTSIN